MIKRLDTLSRGQAAVALLLIMGLAVFLRFWQLDQLPPGLFPDEAANGLDVFRILENRDLRPLYATNGPREALFFYIQAFFVAIMGNTILALRMAPALIGSLAVGATYLWTKEWFGQKTALVATFMMAVSAWAITMSRIGFRASMMPLMIPLVMWAYTKAVRSGKRNWALLAGALLGLGLYTYLSFRMLPIALAVLAIILFVFKRSIFKQWQKTIVTSLIAAGIVILPLFLFGLKYPGDVFVARSSVSFTNPELNKGKPLQTLGDTLVKTALMFNVHGDENYRHNLGGKPQLDPITGLLFLVGLLLCLRYFYRMRYLALLGLFGAMLVPEFVTAEGIPHALRAIGAMPTVFIIAALGLRSIWRWLSKTLSNQGRQRVSWALGLLLAVVGYFGYNQYFVAWANDPETYAAYSEDMVAAAYYMNNNPASGPRIAVVHGFGDITIQYLTHKHVSYQRLDPHGIDELPANLDNYQFVIDKAFADEALSKLYARYPSGRQEAHFSAKTGDLLFYTFAEQQ